MDIGMILITFGIVFPLLGIALMLGVKFPKIPGDIYIKGDGFTFVFPITSSIVISIVFTIILNFLFNT